MGASALLVGWVHTSMGAWPVGLLSLVCEGALMGTWCAMHDLFAC